MDPNCSRFEEQVSDYLLKLMDRVKNEYGSSSKEYKALYNQYICNGLEETNQRENNLKHYEAAVKSDIELPYGVERLYKRQLVIELTFACTSHCRYCLRQNYSKSKFGIDDIYKLVEYCKNDKHLKELLITGGDPFLVPHLLSVLITEIAKSAENITVIRVASRLPVQSPAKFDEKLYSLFKEYNKRFIFEVALQINHKIELQPEARSIIHRLQECGATLYAQNVLLKNVNDDVDTLTDLYEELRYLGIESHYLFHPVPMKGTAFFRLSIQRALRIVRELSSSGRLPGRAKPMLSLMTDAGKVTLYEGSLGEKDADGFYTINTFYKLNERQIWNPSYTLPENAYLDDQGHIIVKYLDGSD